MKSAKEKINDFYQKEKKRKFISNLFGGLFLVAIIFVIIVIVYPPTGEKTLVSGRMDTFYGQASKYGDSLKMIVILDQGQRVTVDIPSKIYFKKGKQVTIIKQKSIFFGRSHYSL